MCVTSDSEPNCRVSVESSQTAVERRECGQTELNLGNTESVSSHSHTAQSRASTRQREVRLCTHFFGCCCSQRQSASQAHFQLEPSYFLCTPGRHHHQSHHPRPSIAPQPCWKHDRASAFVDDHVSRRTAQAQRRHVLALSSSHLFAPGKPGESALLQPRH